MQEPVTRHLIDSLLYLSITDTTFLGMIRASVPPEFFPTRAAERISKLCNSYYDLHSSAPKGHFQDEFARLLQTISKDDQGEMRSFSQRLVEMEKPNSKYVISRLHDFIRARTLEKTAIDVAQLVQRGDYTKAERAMYEALQAGIQRENIGLDYFKDLSPMARRNEVDTPLTSTGWQFLDSQIGGFYRGRVVVVLGKYKGKKTWTLCHIAKEALKRGLCVVHITHEMPEVEIEMRYDRIFGSLTRWGGKETEVTINKWNIQTKKFETDVFSRPSVYNSKAVLRARDAMKRFGGRLIIKKYPMGTCSMLEIDRYIKYLERFKNIVPDVLITDYADIMAPIDPKKTNRDQINDTYIWLKRIADERNILVLTASQATRAGLEKSKFSLSDFAEDIRKVANCDLAIGVGQSPLQESLDIARVAVMVSRDGRQTGIETAFGMALDIGQYNIWEAPMEEISGGIEEEPKGRKRG